MEKNINLKITISLLVIIFGLFFTFLGLENKEESVPISTPVENLATDSASLGVQSNQFLVTKVIDGDTIEIETGQKVRYLGVDTPETVDPRRPVECFGKEAKNKNKQLVEGKRVILEKDISETDKYGRLLRYVYLPMGDNLLFVNDYLIRAGFATVLTYPPDVKFAEQFLKAQSAAKAEKLGLWGGC